MWPQRCIRIPTSLHIFVATRTDQRTDGSATQIPWRQKDSAPSCLICPQPRMRSRPCMLAVFPLHARGLSLHQANSLVDHSTQKNPDDVVITLAIRTPLTRAGKGGFKNTELDYMVYALLTKVIEKSKLDPSLVEDICLGNVRPGNYIRAASGVERKTFADEENNRLAMSGRPTLSERRCLRPASRIRLVPQLSIDSAPLVSRLSKTLRTRSAWGASNAELPSERSR